MFAIQAPGMREDKEFSYYNYLYNPNFNGIYMADNEESAPTYLTDIQWFGRALSEQEISDITSCKSFAKGL